MGSRKTKSLSLREGNQLHSNVTPTCRGFGNEHATEAIKGALTEGQNNPQECPFNLYAEVTF